MWRIKKTKSCGKKSVENEEGKKKTQKFWIGKIMSTMNWHEQ